MSKGEVDPSPNTPPGLKTGMSDLDNLMNEPAVRDALDSMYSGLSGIDAVEAVIAELDEELSVEYQGEYSAVYLDAHGDGDIGCVVVRQKTSGDSMHPGAVKMHSSGKWVAEYFESVSDAMGRAGRTIADWYSPEGKALFIRPYSVHSQR